MTKSLMVKLGGQYIDVCRRYLYLLIYRYQAGYFFSAEISLRLETDGIHR